MTNLSYLKYPSSEGCVKKVFLDGGQSDVFLLVQTGNRSFYLYFL